MSAAPALPSYKHPPVVEVSFGIVFQRLDKMQNRHMGQFWTEQRAQYPTTADLSPVIDANELVAQRLVVMDMPPLRRLMCFSEDKQYVGQVQDSRVHLNWRKVQPADEYPRYEAVRDRFDRLWSDFRTFVEREGIGSPSTLRFELSYFNHIELGENVAASLAEHISFFRLSPVKEGYLALPDSVNVVWNFPMPDHKGAATASIANGLNKEGKNILVLILTCAGTPSEKYTPQQWFASAHEWIVRAFTDLTSTQAHQKWGREE